MQQKLHILPGVFNRSLEISNGNYFSLAKSYFLDYCEQVQCLQKEHFVSMRSRVQPNVMQSICARAKIVPHSALSFLLLNNSSQWSLLPSWVIDLIVWKCPQCFA